MNTQTATEYRNLALSVLTESKTNPRRIFEDDALRELAESIRTSGVVQPLLVRPITEQDFEVVIGAGRFRASKLAEKQDAPCRIANLTYAEVLEIQLVENLQRRDIHPLEEAQGTGPRSPAARQEGVPPSCTFSLSCAVFPPWALLLHGRSDYSRPPDGQKRPRISGAGGTARRVRQSGLRVSITSANVHY